jgi:hypothetical protein
MVVFSVQACSVRWRLGPPIGHAHPSMVSQYLVYSIRIVGECGRCVVRAALGHDRIGTYRAGRPARGGATCWTWSKHAVAAASTAA